jgi:hypothetical protein
MKDDEPTEKEKALEQQLAALREIVNNQKQQAQLKEELLTESEKVLSKKLAKKFLALQEIVKQ